MTRSTPEDQEPRIFSCDNYYEILQVSNKCTDNDIKKAFKKQALLLHPDKNKAPGAEEAFKVVKIAADALGNVTCRIRYNCSGIHEEKTWKKWKEPKQNCVSPSILDVIHKYELKVKFFVKSIPYETKMLMLSVLILTIIAYPFVRLEPDYSLTPRGDFLILRHTMHLEIPYYVTNNFHYKYIGSLRSLEQIVENEYDLMH